jgi:putative resolvase
MNDEQEFINIKQAAKIFGISADVLRKWTNTGRLKCSRTPTNIRLFRLTDIEEALGISYNQTALVKKKVVYCRVSSAKQRDDLDRQIESMQQLYPSYDIIKDIGSGINFNRKGLQSLLVQSMHGELEEVVVAHKDRLCRFGFELIKCIFDNNNTKITILDQEDRKSDEIELSQDIIAFIHVYSCKQMGKRRYSSKNEKNENISNQQTESDSK